MELAKDEGVDGEDSVADKDEGGDYQPVEPLDEDEIGPALLYQSSVCAGVERYIFDRRRRRGSFI